MLSQLPRMVVVVLLLGFGDPGIEQRAFACGKMSGMQVCGSERASPSLETWIEGPVFQENSWF